jgi:DNA modification methylase
LPDNKLYYGDNLDILRRYVGNESVDLIYLDPPFNSSRNYNVLFAEHDGTRAAAQIQAFEDTWQWDESAAEAYHDVVEQGGKVSEVMQAFRLFLGESDMLAYLAMMAPRLQELHRVLKDTGSLYLHCDTAASHYLKLLLDAVFGPDRFRNEIIWARHNARSVKQAIWPRLHDVLLHYAKSDEPYFQRTVVPSGKTAEPHDLVRWADGNIYRTRDLTGAGTRTGETGKPWQGVDVTGTGRHWRTVHAELDKLLAEGRIHWQKNGMPRARDVDPYVPTERTAVVGDVWTDIDSLNSGAQERLGYPTQKPEALLDRIIAASSKPGDVVLDPFCGCGTAIASAQKLGRRWIGIDITHLAINLVRTRLRDAHGDAAVFDVVGEPVSVSGAAQLAGAEPYQFQAWALGLVGARPSGPTKKGADRGIDGRIYFHDEGTAGKTKQAILSVKAGHVTVSQVRDLVGVLDREKAQIGVLISFEEPTKPMRREAASAGIYESPWGKHPRVQLLTVAELLEGRQLDMPPEATNRTFKAAPRAAKKAAAVQRDVFGERE